MEGVERGGKGGRGQRKDGWKEKEGKGLRRRWRREGEKSAMEGVKCMGNGDRLRNGGKG